jgi:hypothetical protein
MIVREAGEVKAVAHAKGKTRASRATRSFPRSIRHKSRTRAQIASNRP